MQTLINLLNFTLPHVDADLRSSICPLIAMLSQLSVKVGHGAAFIGSSKISLRLLLLRTACDAALVDISLGALRNFNVKSRVQDAA